MADKPRYVKSGNEQLLTDALEARADAVEAEREVERLQNVADVLRIACEAVAEYGIRDARDLEVRRIARDALIAAKAMTDAR